MPFAALPQWTDLTPDRQVVAVERCRGAGADLDAASIADALRSWGARAWQIGQTAQVIADAFVSSAQAPEQGSESDS